MNEMSTNKITAAGAFPAISIIRFAAGSQRVLDGWRS